MKATLCSCSMDRMVTHPKSDDLAPEEVQLVFCFGAKAVIEAKDAYTMLRTKYPSAQIIICSTAGEIYDTEVFDHTLTVTALQFEHTPIETRMVRIDEYLSSYAAGQALVRQFPGKDLAYLLVFSDGSMVNGSELVQGMNEVAHDQLLITGGLAGDGPDFRHTLVGLNDRPSAGLVVAVGFYGQHLCVHHGTRGGWEMFGPERTVTKSTGNVLYEINGKNALDLYKLYLGPDAAKLPGSALLFPLAIKKDAESELVVRTILSIDELSGSMTFAGDIPEGAQVRFMRANFDRLTDAAYHAALDTKKSGEQPPKLALLISCVGRKLILQGRTEEEVEAIDEVFNQQTILTGFYSYGEISPFVDGTSCQLHNQTMTITTFSER